LRTFQIPFSDPEYALGAYPGTFLCVYPYPRDQWDNASRSASADCLKAILRDFAVHFKAIEDAKLLAIKAEEEAALLTRLEYSGLSTLEIDRIP
jgi:hypothetical protein